MKTNEKSTDITSLRASYRFSKGETNLYKYAVFLSNCPTVCIYRFIVICFPLKSKTFNSRRNVRHVIIAIWILAFFLAMPLVKSSLVSWPNGY